MTTTDTQYTLIATPGMELFDGCPLCEADHALAACPRWNAETGEPLIAKLRAELATLTKAAHLAYDAIDWQLECWSADDDGTPPSDMLNAHAALFGLLHHRQEATNDGDKVPF